MSVIPDNLKYTEEHEWVSIEGNIATCGITDFAQNELGDIVYVDISTVGETLSKNDVFGSVEAVKTVSDLFLPVTGTILQLNENLEDQPDLINSDPYSQGWIVKVEITDDSTLNSLLSPDDYRQHLGE